MDTKLPPERPESGRSSISPLRAGLSALAVVALCASLSIGASVRDRVDRAGSRASEPLVGIVASRDKDAGGIDLDAYYDAVERILKENYVEPIKDETKLAVGAVRGMVTSLGDPRSQFMDKEAFAAFQQVQEGHFAGIGVDFNLQSNGIDLSADDEVTSDTDPTSDFAATRIPRLVVNSVVPGGPADKAGVKPGDWVESVDGHWVIDSELIAHYRKLAATVVANSAGTVKPTPEFDALKSDIRAKADTAIMPLRALTILSLGAGGTAKVTWAHDGQPLRTVTIQKAAVINPANQAAVAVPRLRFGKDAPEFLKTLLAGKRALTLDLRGEPAGYFDSMLACFQLVAPAGTYGAFVSQHKGKLPTPFATSTGNSSPPKLTLLVDGSVRGPAAIFALALSSKGLAKLQGSEVSADRSRVLVEGLPDGSGFTLVTGDYRPTTAVASRIKGGRA